MTQANGTAQPCFVVEQLEDKDNLSDDVREEYIKYAAAGLYTGAHIHLSDFQFALSRITRRARLGMSLRFSSGYITLTSYLKDCSVHSDFLVVHDPIPRSSEACPS